MEGGTRGRIEQIRAFAQDVNQETRRVTWPTGKELLGATVVVVLTTAILSALLSIFDLVISRVIRAILS